MVSPFAILILLGAIWARGPRMLLVFIVAGLFGASAAASVPGLGDAPLTPIVFALPFLIARTMQRFGMRSIVHQMAYPSEAFWLSMLVIWGLFGAAFLPRLFEGDTYVYTTVRASVGTSIQSVPLRPNSTNLTQSCYLIGAWVGFLCVRQMCTTPEGVTYARRGVCLLAFLNILFALWGLGEFYAGLPPVLVDIKNASYEIIGDAEVNGLVRITGTFSEASAFAAFTLPVAAFTLQLARFGNRWAAVLAFVSFALLIASTSSTAYGALLVYMAVCLCWMVFRAVFTPGGPKLGATTWLLWGSLVVVCVVLLSNPPWLQMATQMFNDAVLNKMDSSSGIERGSWNRQALTNLMESAFVGVGVGSARGSGYLMVLLSNVGVLGGLLFLGFLYMSLRGSLADPRQFESEQDRQAQALRAAAFHGVIGTLIAAGISATMFDLGLLFYTFAGVCAGARDVIGKVPVVPALAERTASEVRRERKLLAIGGRRG